MRQMSSLDGAGAAPREVPTRTPPGIGNVRFTCPSPARSHGREPGEASSSPAPRIDVVTWSWCLRETDRLTFSDGWPRVPPALLGSLAVESAPAVILADRLDGWLGRAEVDGLGVDCLLANRVGFQRGVQIAKEAREGEVPMVLGVDLGREAAQALSHVLFSSDGDVDLVLLAARTPSR